MIPRPLWFYAARRCGVCAGYADRGGTQDFLPRVWWCGPVWVVNAYFAEADESKLDTERIQKAIDGCKAGQAVELKADGAHDALCRALALRPGITLLVAQRNSLRSRNPRDYDLSAGSCGIVNESGRGCKPLIGETMLPTPPVMGDGLIDGRGWAKLTGQNLTWWDSLKKRAPEATRTTRA